jgi:hypothetical protein
MIIHFINAFRIFLKHPYYSYNRNFTKKFSAILFFFFISNLFNIFLKKRGDLKNKTCQQYKFNYIQANSYKELQDIKKKAYNTCAKWAKQYKIQFSPKKIPANQLYKKK